MNRWRIIFWAALGAGATQFGILWGTGVHDLVPLAAGTIGTIATTVGGLLKQLPRDEWPPEKRDQVTPIVEPKKEAV